ncbi:GNAT family N-acetyltransferase [Rathayibacter sp. VKM Ac-2754]|uniref:GNAT family N-acetyltransferase n=1 Tax=Rathayibacter sp. VKM Ac-2754 TaxID=2609251 RepID=UPI0013591A66|nr:GNAT family N-acetyltransferase [Rathayibacter sp. VKM Ac-2754]MWV59160.1 GNAT family N-acetyltransferase [Rathayibacter sp. VKM Ac-2754]
MDARLLDHLASAAWPPLERRDLDGWQLRAASGVTKRANSVLTSGPVPDVARAIAEAEEFARDRGIPPLFQLGPASDPADLPDLLATRGYEPHDRTLILTGSVAEALAALPEAGIEACAVPDDDWMSLWWSVDGRGGAAERDVAQRILAGCDSSYALLRDEGGPAACGRLAHVAAPDGEQWSGLFALATRPDARRRGHASAVVRTLLERARGERFWLQVLADNAGARRLYASLGCRESSWYEYWRA